MAIFISSLDIKPILIVETDRSILDVITIILQEYGYQVLATNCYEVAIQLYREVKPALVIIDYKINGLQATILLSKLKSEWPVPKFLAISCNVDLEKKYTSLGFDGFIAKPFDLADLVSVVTGLLN